MPKSTLEIDWSFMLAFSSMVKELVQLCPAIETGDVFFCVSEHGATQK
jgi:hypothetical protein